MAVAGPWKAAVAVCILQLAVCAHAFVGVPPPTLLGHPGATCARAHRASSLVCLKAQLTATELPTAEAFTTLANAKLRKVRSGCLGFGGGRVGLGGGRPLGLNFEGAGGR